MARTIEHLVKLYPNKTGAEILKIRETELLEDEQREKDRLATKQIIVDEIKENGGYFRGAFGTCQYYMYKIKNIYIDNDSIYCDVEQIILFNSLNVGQSCIPTNTFNYEINLDKFIRYDDITFGTERITEKEYNELKDCLFGVVPKFFPTEWNERQSEFGTKSEK